MSFIQVTLLTTLRDTAFSVALMIAVGEGVVAAMQEGVAVGEAIVAVTQKEFKSAEVVGVSFTVPAGSPQLEASVWK